MGIGAEWLDGVRRRIRSALEKAARDVLAEAQARVPSRTGALRESLRIEADTDEGRDAVLLRSDLPYALPVEMQTPFLRPSLLEARNDMLVSLAESVTAEASGL